MGRSCTLEEWSHFRRLDDLGKIENSPYFWVVCRHCEEAYHQAPPEERVGLDPVKLQGRKSSMQAHLSKCKYYTGPPLAPKSRKRNNDNLTNDKTKRGRICDMEEWDHFIRLDEEGHVGSTKYYFAICRYCQYAYDSLPSKAKLENEPPKIVGRKHSLRNHLKSCINYRACCSDDHPFLEAGPMKQTIRRAQMEEWKYFTRIDQKAYGVYHYANCTLCLEAHMSNPEVKEPENIVGRKSAMRRHLKKCPYFEKAGFTLPEPQKMFDPAELESPLIKPSKNTGSCSRRQGSSNYRATSDSDNKLSATELVDFHTALIELTAALNLPLNWIETPEAINLITILRPIIPACGQVPKHAELSSFILRGAAEKSQKGQCAKLKEQVGKFSTTLCIKKFSLLEASGVFICDLQSNGICVGYSNLRQIPSKNINSDAVVKHIESRLQCAKNDGFEVVAIASDDDPVYSRSRRILSYRWPSIITFPCLANQVNYLVYTFFRNPVTTSVMETVLATIHSICKPSSPLKKIFETLQTEQRGFAWELYGINHTWRSFHSCIASFLNSKDVIVEIAEKHHGVLDPELCLELLNEELWNSTQAVEQILRPFTEASFVIKCINDSLGYVLYFFGQCYHVCSNNEKMLEELEKLWSDYEHPIAILANALNPRFKLKGVNATKLTKWSNIADIAVSYYERFYGKKPKRLRSDVMEYGHCSASVFTETFIEEFRSHKEYYLYLRDEYAELSCLMLRLASMIPHASDCESLYNQATDTYSIEQRKYMETIRKGMKLNCFKHSKKWNVILGTDKSLMEKQPDDWKMNVFEGGINANTHDRMEEIMNNCVSALGCNSSMSRGTHDDIEDPVYDSLVDDGNTSATLESARIYLSQKISLKELFNDCLRCPEYIQDSCPSIHQQIVV